MEQCNQAVPIGKAAYSADINKAIESDQRICESNQNHEGIFGSDWYVSVLDGVYLRENHDTDTACLRGYLSRDREGTYRTWPWTVHPFIAVECGLFDYENDGPIRKLHQKCISLCLEVDQNPSRQKALNGMRKKYLEYRKDRDLIVTDPCTPVDYVLTDSSISTIIGAMWPGLDYTNFYNDIGEEIAQFFFSRRKNGRYSETANKEFGYPNNVVAQSSSAHLPADYLSNVSKTDENHSTKHGLDRTLSPLRKRLRTHC